MVIDKISLQQQEMQGEPIHWCTGKLSALRTHPEKSHHGWGAFCKVFPTFSWFSLAWFCGRQARVEQPARVIAPANSSLPNGLR